MQRNETKESEAYCTDVNCYWRRQKLQEKINKEFNDVNEVNRENIAFNDRLVLLEKHAQIMTRY